MMLASSLVESRISFGMERRRDIDKRGRGEERSSSIPSTPGYAHSFSPTYFRLHRVLSPVTAPLRTSLALRGSTAPLETPRDQLFSTIATTTSFSNESEQTEDHTRLLRVPIPTSQITVADSDHTPSAEAGSAWRDNSTATRSPTACLDARSAGAFSHDPHEGGVEVC